MNIKQFILNELKKRGKVTTHFIANKMGFTRSYIHRFMQEMVREGSIRKNGKTRGSVYAINDSFQDLPLQTHLILKNTGLKEDAVFKRIRQETDILKDLPKELMNLVEYSFQEMVNNAIEHSQSEKIDIIFRKTEPEIQFQEIQFQVRDFGIGIFNNIMKKNKQNDVMEAIQNLLKGKQTTVPETHTGEGIFFTSKIADFFVIKSFGKKIVFDNSLQDIAVYDIKPLRGTDIIFKIALSSPKNLNEIFSRYTDDSFLFNKTDAIIRLFVDSSSWLSRSQARRVISGLEKFKTVTLDFEGVDTIGQAFADEIFRVWQGNHPQIVIQAIHTNENIDFMIRRAGKDF